MINDDNDVAELIFLLLLVVVAVDCWFLMPALVEEWQRSGRQKGRQTLRARCSEGQMEVICTRLKLFCLIDLQQLRTKQNYTCAVAFT